MRLIPSYIKCLFSYIFILNIIFISCNEKKSGIRNNKSDQKSETLKSPDLIYGSLFYAVQMEQVFADGKTFADCIPRRPPQDIVAEFQDQQKEPDFDLRKFVLDNFDLPVNHTMPEITMQKDIRKHIADLWPRLTRQADTVVKSGSLLPLPNPYIVPGGRFREVYYWDSYFTMLGLKVSGRVDLMEHMVNNFAYLIKTHGHIPNGNRTYYLSRSQPPFFGMMVALLAETKGDDKVYETYLDVLEKEYLYWMEGDKSLKPGQKSKRVVLTKEGYYLNRYFDERNDARPESYREDMLTANEGVTDVLAGMRFASEAAKDSFASKRKSVIFRNLRSGAESGWDFSSRWLSDAEKLYTLRVIHLIPVDLNCLLYFNERLLQKQFHHRGDTIKANAYKRWADERAEAILKYCYNEATGFFSDYNFHENRIIDRITAAGLFPLYFLDPELLKDKTEGVARVVEKHLLAPGGLLTTNITSGQQWDAPNGWAPLQWMAVCGLERCGHQALAREIAKRWIKLNAGVFERTGKLMEKYNVVDTKLEAGGGEYPGQDGFGWTNGVLLALMEKYE